MIAVAAVDASEVLITGPEALKQWRDRHRLLVPGHEHEPLFKSGRWDGYKVTGKWCRVRGTEYEMRCSRGLVPRILRDLELDYAFDLVGVAQEEIDTFCEESTTFGKLRDYQQRAVRGVLTEGWGRVAFATNAGKGAVMGLLARFARDRGTPVLILCDELGVFDALQGEIETWGGFTPGVIARGLKSPPVSLVTLAMIPTLQRRLRDEKPDRGPAEGPWTEWIQSIGMVLVDEADKANAATYRLILDAATNTTWRGGFSGTFSDDLYPDLRLDEVLGPIIERVQNAALIERGVSARPTVEVRAFDVTSSLTFPREYFRETLPGKRRMVFQAAITTNQERHAFVASLIRPGIPTAVIINRIEHGLQLSAAIPGSVFLDGSMGASERIRLLDEFKAGTIQTIVVTKILDRGTNRLGHAEDLVFASGEGSTTQTLQRVGRGLRRGGGKEFLRIVDVMDRVAIEPWSDRTMKQAATFIHSGVRRRLAVYGKEGFDIEIIK